MNYPSKGDLVTHGHVLLSPRSFLLVVMALGCIQKWGNQKKESPLPNLA